MSTRQAEHARTRGEKQSSERHDDDQQTTAKRVGLDDPLGGPSDPLMSARAIVQALPCDCIGAVAEALQVPRFRTYVNAVAGMAGCADRGDLNPGCR